MAAIEREVLVDHASAREATLVSSPYTHPGVRIALASPLVDAHPPARALIVAPKPLSTRAPTSLAKCWRCC